jgi:hypothetical protein
MERINSMPIKSTAKAKFKIYSFLVLTTAESGQFYFPSALTLVKKPSCTCCTGDWMGPKALLGVTAKKNIQRLLQGIENQPSL